MPSENGSAPPPSADPFDKATAEVRARIDKLNKERQAAAFDALTDKEKRGQLITIERNLSAATDDLERLDLARVEAARRGQEKAERAEQERRQAALAEVDQVVSGMATEDQKIKGELSTLAKRVAHREGLGHKQATALSRAGQRGWASMPDMLTWTIEAFLTEGASVGWLDK
jgi:hypothetical protein